MYDFSHQQFQFSRTQDLKRRQDNGNVPAISQDKLQKFGINKKDESHFQRTFKKILKVRIPGTEGSRQVRQVMISQSFESKV